LLNCKLFFILLDILAADIFSNSAAFAIVSQVFNTHFYYLKLLYNLVKQHFSVSELAFPSEKASSIKASLPL